MATIIVRASTNSLMDDAERTINDCVNTIKCMIRDKRFLPGAGSIEIVFLHELTFSYWPLKLRAMLQQLQD